MKIYLKKNTMWKIKPETRKHYLLTWGNLQRSGEPVLWLESVYRVYKTGMEQIVKHITFGTRNL